MVFAGETETNVPLVTAPTPLFTLPVPFVKTAVRVVEAPAVMGEAEVTKLVMTGAATTVTVTCLVAVAPAVFVTVNV